MFVALNWVVTFGGQNEIRRNQLGALMNELEEGMLSIGARFSKENCTGCVIHILAVTSNGFAV